jgi:hypothetical protein
MAKSDDRIQTVNELWQKIFNLTQDEKIMAISSNIKAYSGDQKWIIHVPGLCKISLKLDMEAVPGEKAVSQESPIEGMEGETGFMTGKKPKSAPVNPEGNEIGGFTQDFEYGE